MKAIQNKILQTTVLAIGLSFLTACGGGGSGGGGETPSASADKTLLFLDDARYGVEPWMSDGTVEGTKLLKDINQKKDVGSHIGDKVSIGATLYFTADDGTHGRELWKSDASGVSMVQDIHPGVSSSNIHSLTNVGGMLYFSADNGRDGSELWKYDGVEASMVKDIHTGKESAYPQSLTNVAGVLYFRANDGTHGVELWKSEGTAGTTVLVHDIVAGEESSLPWDLTNVDGKLYFSAEDAAHGRELWKSDATGTTLLRDIHMGTVGSRLGELTAIGDTLYFTADDGVEGKELWKSRDGTTELAVASGLISSPRQLTVVNGILHFTATDSAHGNELWFIGLFGPRRVDINVGSGRSSPEDLIDVNGKLYFTADDGRSGRELWQFDAFAVGGPVLVKDITAGTGSTRFDNLTHVNGTVYFTVGDALWKSNGTEAGTVVVLDTSADANPLRFRQFSAHADTLYFVGDDGEHGKELWMSDGTQAGTVLAKDIRQTTNHSTSIQTKVMKIGDNYYFAAYDGAHGTELWKSDGTQSGTVMLKDIQAGEYGSSPQKLRKVNDTLYFVAGNDANGREIWRSDGTQEGTVLLRDINPGVGSIVVDDMAVLNNVLYFTLSLFGGPNPGKQLWKSDSTGTTLVKEIGGGALNPVGLSFAEEKISLINIGNTLFFAANDGSSGIELWKSDGTPEGTALVKNIKEDVLLAPEHSKPEELTDINGILYFSADDGVNGRELWKSDGTQAGTVLLKNIRDDAGGIKSSHPKSIRNVDGTAYFSAKYDFASNELWKSDGTEAGTVLVKLLEEKYIDDLAYVNNQLYVSIERGEDSFGSLWKSDGTDAGTEAVHDFDGRVRWIINMLDTIENGLLFTTIDTYDVMKLWKSDGSEDGTQVLADGEGE